MSVLPKKSRIDQMLVHRGLAPTRARARDMVGRGCIKVDGETAHKAGQLVSENCTIEVDDPAKDYVSRAALKLIAGLDHAGITVENQHAIDLGASTGGFTQVLLERGAASVLAVDVGHGQMDARIANHPKVISLEGVNARSLSQDHLLHVPSLIVSDLSFVSLTIAAEPALLLAADKAQCVLLIKPQFEVGRDGIGKGGLVTDQNLIDATLENLSNWLNKLPGWKMTHLAPSPITGGDGNKEYLLCGVRNA